MGWHHWIFVQFFILSTLLRTLTLAPSFSFLPRHELSPLEAICSRLIPDYNTSVEITHKTGHLQLFLLCRMVTNEEVSVMIAIATITEFV
jgi:hypothetical protein